MTKTEGEDGGYQTEATLFLDWLASNMICSQFYTKIAILDDTTVVVADNSVKDSRFPFHTTPCAELRAVRYLLPSCFTAKAILRQAYDEQI